MQYKRTLAALAAALSLSSAQALEVVNVGAFTLTYDETSDLGYLSGWYTSLGWQGFNWSIPQSVQVASVNGAPATASFDLPWFQVAVNPGWTLTGNVAGFLGNLVYNLVGATAAAGATVSGSLSIDGGPAMPVGGTLTQTATAGAPGVFEVGFFAGSQSGNIGPFSSMVFSGGLLTLNASGGSFAAVTAQPQNQMKIDIAVAEVPEPAALGLMLGGLAVLALRKKRPSA